MPVSIFSSTKGNSNLGCLAGKEEFCTSSWRTSIPSHSTLKSTFSVLLVHAKNTRAEPGCVRFDVLQVTDDPNSFRLYEVYRDEQAFEEHGENPIIAATLGKVADWKAEPTV